MPIRTIILIAVLASWATILPAQNVQDKQLYQKVVKEAGREAKKLQKEGYKVPIGKITMEKQLERAIKLQYETIDNKARYMLATANAVAKDQHIAKLQAIDKARIDLVEQIQQQLGLHMIKAVNSREITQEDAELVNKSVYKSKDILPGKLGQVITAIEIFRELPTGEFESRITLAYDIRDAFRIAVNIIHNDLSKQTDSLNQQLRNILNL